MHEFDPSHDPSHDSSDEPSGDRSDEHADDHSAAESDEGAAAALVGAVGHELRHLVGALVHQIELITGDELDDAIRRRSLRALAEGGSELGRFVDTVTDLERTLRGEFVVDRVPIDLRALIRAVIVDRSADGGGLAGGTDVVVVADEASLRRMLQLLVAECESHSGTVTVELSDGDGRVEILLTCGPHVDRRSDSEHRVAVADGIGPWIVGRLALLSNAEIHVRSSPRSFVVRFTAGVASAM